MGSYLSIVNDTSDLWVCKIEPDEAALTIFTIVTSIIAAIASVIATMGAAAPACTALVANGWVSILGISTSSAATLATAAAGLTGIGYISGGTGVAVTIVNLSLKAAYQNGYQPIPPGKSYRWGKMSLSLWQQGHCKRHIVLDKYNFYSDELYMRPIFSGATDNSNIDHRIQYWINKVGTTNKFKTNIVSDAVSTNALAKTSVDSISTLGDNTNSSTPFICDICGNGLSILQPDGITFIPGFGNLTCSFIDKAGKNGNITREQCPLVSQFLTPCGCNVPPKGNKRERAKGGPKGKH